MSRSRVVLRAAFSVAAAMAALAGVLAVAGPASAAPHYSTTTKARSHALVGYVHDGVVRNRKYIVNHPQTHGAIFRVQHGRVVVRSTVSTAKNQTGFCVRGTDPRLPKALRSAVYDSKLKRLYRAEPPRGGSCRPLSPRDIATKVLLGDMKFALNLVGDELVSDGHDGSEEFKSTYGHEALVGGVKTKVSRTGEVLTNYVVNSSDDLNGYFCMQVSDPALKYPIRYDTGPKNPWAFSYDGSVRAHGACAVMLAHYQP